MTKCTILFVFCSDNGLKMWGWYYINIKVCQVIGVDGDIDRTITQVVCTTRTMTSVDGS